MLPDETNKPYNYEDEINLKELIINILTGFKKNLTLIVSLIILGGLVAFASFKLIKPVYKTQLLLNAKSQLAQNAVNIINTWEAYISKHDYASLSAKTGINIKYLEKIKKIDAEIKGEEDKESKSVGFSINLSIYKTEILDSIENNLIKYLKKKSTDRNATRIKELTGLRKQYKSEISKLDSINIDVQNLIKRGPVINNPFLSDPGSITEAKADLYERDFKLEQEIIALNEIQLVDGFTKTDIADSPKLIKFLAIGLFAGLVLSLVIIFFKSIMES